MSRLNKQFPVFDTLKMYMRENEDISEDQIKGYSRRVKSSPMLMLHLELLQNFQNTMNNQAKHITDLRKEQQRTEYIVRDNCREIETLKEKVERLEDQVEQLISISKS
jgi:predicted nuclease with TOPRIM domain